MLRGLNFGGEQCKSSMFVMIGDIYFTCGVLTLRVF